MKLLVSSWPPNNSLANMFTWHKLVRRCSSSSCYKDSVPGSSCDTNRGITQSNYVQKWYTVHRVWPALHFWGQYRYFRAKMLIKNIILVCCNVHTNIYHLKTTHTLIINCSHKMHYTLHDIMEKLSEISTQTFLVTHQMTSTC